MLLTLRSVTIDNQLAKISKRIEARNIPVEIEPSHENNTVNNHLPLCLQHTTSLSSERRESNMVMRIRLLGLQELFALREQQSGESDGHGQASGNPENSLPCLGCSSHTEIGAGCEDVPKGVSLLQDTGHQTSCVDGAMFKSHSDGVSVNSSHEETEEGTDSEELVEGLGVDGRDLKQTHWRSC